ncbi:hypothetical protein HAALTHF_38930n [Vreelandella aquamarina]|nr:hypothetical protein HAALTHF_38930n [Halomonas axialensis]
MDPIDGTVNFAQGLRHVAVSIGWMEQGVGKVGVIHAPFLGETFSAAEGLGAFCNQQPIQPSGAETLESTLVGTGFPYQKSSVKTSATLRSSTHRLSGMSGVMVQRRWICVMWPAAV